MRDDRRAISLLVGRAGCRPGLLSGAVRQIAIHGARLAPGSFRPRLFVVSVALGLSQGASAYAGLMIHPTYAPSITTDPNSVAIEGAIQAAINIYQADFTDPINVAITFAEGGGLGSSSTAYANVSYASYITALRAEIPQTGNDVAALKLLPFATTNPVNGSSTINVKTANLRAIGIPVFPTSGPDGTITLNTSLTTPGSSGTTGTYMLQVVTEHEIDEVLGLGSSLPGTSFGTIFPEDLFRYDASGTKTRSFTTSSSAKAFFSINGKANLAQFHNKTDGADFGDWESNPLPSGVSPKVQDAFATPFSNPSLGIELTALDVIGYDPNPSVHNNFFLPKPTFAATSFTTVLKGYAGGSIDPVATANDPTANAFAYVNQHFFGGSGTTSVTVTLDSEGNTVVTYTGSHPILSTYAFDYGTATNGKPHFGFQGMEGSTVLQQHWNSDRGSEFLPTLSVTNPFVAGLDVAWATLFAEVTCGGQTGGQWVEDAYTKGIAPTWQLTNSTSCTEILSNVGYFFTSAELSLDDLNFGSKLPALIPFLGLDGLSLLPDASITVTAAPEPATWLLIATGLAGLLVTRQRRAGGGHIGPGVARR